MHSLLSLITVFFLIVVLYIYAGVEFLSFLFLIVYVGAIAILFLFVIILLQLKEKIETTRQFSNKVMLLSIPLTIFVAVSIGNFFHKNLDCYFGRHTGSLIISTTQSSADVTGFIQHRYTDVLLPPHTKKTMIMPNTQKQFEKQEITEQFRYIQFQKTATAEQLIAASRHRFHILRPNELPLLIGFFLFCWLVPPIFYMHGLALPILNTYRADFIHCAFLFLFITIMR